MLPHLPLSQLHPPDVTIAPRNRAELSTWLRQFLELEFPSAPLIPSHQTPLDYLAHAFFQGRSSFKLDNQPEEHDPLDTPPRPIDSVVWAARGSGKTFLGAVATALDLLYKPGIEIRILGGSLDQSKRMYAHLRNIFSRDALAHFVDGRISETRLTLTNGSQVELLAQSHSSVRGTRVQTLRCDETELFKDDLYEAAMLTTRSKRFDIPGVGSVTIQGSVECLSTMHEPYGIMQRVVSECAEGSRTLFKWGVLDVLAQCGKQHSCQPSESAAQGCPLFVDCAGRAKLREGNDSNIALGHMALSDVLRMQRRVSLGTWNAEMLCTRPNRSNSVIPDFDLTKHVFSDWSALRSGEWAIAETLLREKHVRDIYLPHAGLQIICGMDFGITSPAVIVWGAHNTETDTIFIFDERSVANATTAEHAQSILDGNNNGWRRPAWIGVDPAGAARQTVSGSSDIEVLKEMGFRHDVRFKHSENERAFELIRRRLAPASRADPRLYIHERCRHLIKSLEQYHYESNKEKRKPHKDGNDHAVDALKYLILGIDGHLNNTDRWWNYSQGEAPPRRSKSS